MSIADHISSYTDFRQLNLPDRYIDRNFGLYYIFWDPDEPMGVRSRISEAVAKFVIRNDPENALFLAILANRYFDLKDFAKAESYIIKALVLDQIFEYSLYIKYRIYSELYGTADAVKVLEKLLALDEYDVVSLFYLSKLDADYLKITRLECLTKLYNLPKKSEDRLNLILGERIQLKEYAKKAIKEIDLHFYRAAFFNCADYFTEECIICNLSLKKLNIVKLICGHYYHYHCLIRCDFCPLCREAKIFMTDGDDVQFFE